MAARRERQDPPGWWAHVPPRERPRRRLTVLRLRLRTWLRRRGVRITALVALYASLCLLLLLRGLGTLAVVALMPLLLVPPLGVLAYWLVWKEFHH